MPSFLRDILKCMCCNNGEVSPDEYLGREGIELPYRPYPRPAADSARFSVPAPYDIPARPELRDNPSPNESGPPTVLLVPRNRPQQDPVLQGSRSASEAFVPHNIEAQPAKLSSLTTTHPEDLPATPTPQAKQRPAQTQTHPIQKRRVDSHTYRPDDPRVAMPSKKEGSVGLSAVEEGVGSRTTQHSRIDL